MRGLGFIFLLALAADWSPAAELWSLKPVQRSGYRHSSVDGYIREAWAAHGLAGSAPADKRTLIRRATFDLTGLPPTMTDVEAFAHDDSPSAYARLIERLLASPQYGEQWARHWLDVARYSDTKGYVYAREEKMWVHAAPYRDWVVQALNADMPYDRFLLLQIAADQVAQTNSPDLAAMGFLTVGRRFLGVTHDIIDDRIDVVMRGAQALTVACARCHDHKFDPIPTRDYYALYGVFQSSAEALVPCSAGINHELDALLKKNRELLSLRRDEQMKRSLARVREYLEAQMELDQYPEEAFGQILDAADLNPFIVRRWQAFLEQQRVAHDPIFAPWHRFAKSPVSKFNEVWSQLRAAPAGEVSARVMQGFPQAPADMHEVARIYAEVLSSAELKPLLEGIASPCFVPDEHIANSEMYFPTGVTTELWKSQGDVDRFIIRNKSAPAYATILRDRPLPSEPRVFIRGNPLTKGEVVPRQFLGALGGTQPFARGSGRMELAQAIIHPSNPLTARVMVNRIWQQHFGRGIVSTPSDFGKQGSPPSHPELLDWLAQDFMDSGWSVKSMHRRLMLSQTYQQASWVVAATSPSLDPDNRWLWRMNTHRLSFEEARDTWLTAAGRLDLQVGGRPVALFAPSHWRRTLYSLIDRESLSSVLRTFDFANPDLSIPQRTETIVAQQALFGMNHPFVVQQARALVLRLQEGEPMEMNIRQLYASLFQRLPSEDELAAARVFISAAKAPQMGTADHSKSWQYGYGEWDAAAGKLKSFTPLPHFTGTAWQGTEKWPNEVLGWAQLTATGGHPGDDRSHAVVRRWIAPADGQYAVKSMLLHEPAPGDGIRAFVSHNQKGRLHEQRLHQDTVDLNFESLDFLAGDTIDFIVDIGDGLNSDQFLWSLRISRAATSGAGGDISAETWDAEKDFSALPSARLNAWEQLAQVLMLSNEMMFVD